MVKGEVGDRRFVSGLGLVDVEVAKEGVQGSNWGGGILISDLFTSTVHRWWINSILEFLLIDSR